jgi:endonuclease/exonuclease/phosphatase family metal-dependent hydrolase
MTYNIRYDNTSDSLNNWKLRKQELAAQVLRYEPDVLGIQEGLSHQVDFLNMSLTDYSFVGVGRDDGKSAGEYAAVFFKTALFNVVRKGTFWLSDSPEKPSVGWDAALPRICTFVLLQHKTNGKSFWVFNTHFDHRGAIAQKESVDLILKKADALNNQGLPMVIMGDFNLTPDTAPIQLMASKMDDAMILSGDRDKEPKGTFNGFGKRTDDLRIDYIFVRNFHVENCFHIGDLLKSGRHISDHYPVFSVMQ